MNVVSPVYGTISNISDNSITIYISPNDNHNIFAPIDGTISEIDIVQGYWKRRVFHAYEDKIGRTIIYISNICLPEDISFWLEVGKPMYITDRIQLNKDIDDYVKKGELIGEIILGSLCEIHFHNLNHQNKIRIGDKVIGGNTILTRLIK